jgi:hypothetical protein
MNATPAGDAVARRNALQGWWQLSDEERREVLRRSRAGEHHPDQEVAWVAWRWAETVLPPGAPEPGKLRNIFSAIGFWFLILIHLDGGNALDPPEPGWLDRRRARPILRVGPPVR